MNLLRKYFISDTLPGIRVTQLPTLSVPLLIHFVMKELMDYDNCLIQ